ncbi:Uncharacterised protein [Bordetella avium]|nr:Uncharacterised protein [Bordetella avium]
MSKAAILLGTQDIVNDWPAKRLHPLTIYCAVSEGLNGAYWGNP